MEMYNSLYTDLAMNEKYISEDVIADDLRCEAYLLYKKEQSKKQKTKNFEDKKKKITPSNIPGIRFMRK